MILFIYGNGGLGKEVYDIATRANSMQNRYSEILFINDFNSDGEKVLSLDDAINRFNNREACEFIVGVGEVHHRHNLCNKLERYGLNLAKIIDPSAIISPSATIADGVIICPQVWIGPNADIGKNSLLNVAAIIGHDIKVGQNCVISSSTNIGGNCIISNNCFIGMNCTIKEKVKMGQNSVLGMSSSLYRDLDDYHLALGNPARIIQKIDLDFKVFD